MTPEWITILDLIAISAYAVIAVFAFIGFCLYFSAYKEMKRTRIIGAVSLLLFCIFLDTTFWFSAEFLRFSTETRTYIPFTVHPLTLLIAKLVLATGVIFFVLTSVKKQTPELCSEFSTGVTETTVANGKHILRFSLRK